MIAWKHECKLCPASSLWLASPVSPCMREVSGAINQFAAGNEPCERAPEMFCHGSRLTRETERAIFTFSRFSLFSYHYSLSLMHIPRAFECFRSPLASHQSFNTHWTLNITRTPTSLIQLYYLYLYIQYLILYNVCIHYILLWYPNSNVSR